MTSIALGSVMFPKSVESTIYTLFATKPVTMNLHSCGIDPAEWNQNDNLRSQYPLLATNLDSNGREFGSAFESTASGSNILAVQFHPERSQFEFDYPEIGHTDGDLDAAWYLARLVRTRLQLCTIHRYATPEAANAALIGNYPLSYTGWGKGYYWVSLKAPAVAASSTSAMVSGGTTTAAPSSSSSSSSSSSGETFQSTAVWAMGLIVLFAAVTFGVALRVHVPSASK
ncbi:gamma-glutamyl hydrolase, putative [Bodo saltans]|uniref:Gamma-glutamyl hydrolase, putative n=1 Tax=Bodo saltans TaxID=75058 RepID=A0A0S4JMZ5_BODSA|nr:gamma-glutamyl hydrolase, putative [Bodo saltans]|eukprot:CUG91782.1 gamma-glutamyl hydrolase, putative [Bodo saltans]